MKLSADQVRQKLAGRAGWALEGDSIRREYLLDDFPGAIAFIVRVGFEAEAADHHPDFLLSRYKRVTLTYTTHSAGGLTDKDFVGAAAADAVYGAWKRAN